MPSVTPSPTEGGGGGGGGFLDNLSIQVVAVLGVIVILVLLVIILSLIICICCLCRSKTSIEVSAAHSIENPDYYNGKRVGRKKEVEEDLILNDIYNDYHYLPDV